MHQPGNFVKIRALSKLIWFSFNFHKAEPRLVGDMDTLSD